MKTQRRLAAQLLGVSEKKIVFSNDRLADIKESITKTDIRRLIAEKAITKRPVSGISRARARKITIQKSKGLRVGKGSRQGKKTARLPRKESWMNKIRSQRKILSELKSKGLISPETFRKMYLRAKGGFFRSARHIKIYLEEHRLFLKKEGAKKPEEKEAPVKKKAVKKTVKKKAVKKKVAKKKSE